jgi:hypothetical protein
MNPMRSRTLRLVAAAAVLFFATAPVRTAGAAPVPGCRMLLSTVAPVGTASCGGVRPGAAYSASNGNGCSMNFVFLGGDHRYYVGTAGHCLWAQSNFDGPVNKEESWTPGHGVSVSDGNGSKVGQFAYGVWNSNRDFALIRLDPGVRPSPAMCYFGGPTGLYTDHSSSTVFLKQFGAGLLFGDTIPARTEVAQNTTSPYFVYAYGASAPGDSGSGVMTADGRAIGTLVELISGFDVGGGSALVGTWIGITRLDTSVVRAEQTLHTTLKLQTAPLNADIVGL